MAPLPSQPFAPVSGYQGGAGSPSLQIHMVQVQDTRQRLPPASLEKKKPKTPSSLIADSAPQKRTIVRASFLAKQFANDF